MSAGTKVVQLRDALAALIRYAAHHRDCPYDAGGTCQCGLLDLRRIARHLTIADPARTGHSASLTDNTRRST